MEGVGGQCPLGARRAVASVLEGNGYAGINFYSWCVIFFSSRISLLNFRIISFYPESTLICQNQRFQILKSWASYCNTWYIQPMNNCFSYHEYIDRATRVTTWSAKIWFMTCSRIHYSRGCCCNNGSHGAAVGIVYRRFATSFAAPRKQSELFLEC